MDNNKKCSPLCVGAKWGPAAGSVNRTSSISAGKCNGAPFWGTLGLSGSQSIKTGGGGTAFARNSGCTKRKLHLHGCLPTPCPQFRAGRGICIEFVVAYHHNTPPITHRWLESSNIEGHSANTAGSERWPTSGGSNPNADGPNHLVVRTWYESQAAGELLWSTYCINLMRSQTH